MNDSLTMQNYVISEYSSLPHHKVTKVARSLSVLSPICYIDPLNVMYIDYNIVCDSYRYSVN